jgi:hypothetical protein
MQMAAYKTDVDFVSECSPADSTRAAHCNNRDFSTRWQLG